MIAIVVSQFNKPVIDGLLTGCQKALHEGGYGTDSIHVRTVPGAFELAAAAKKLAEQDGIDSVITLGAVIKGETDHYHYISEAVSDGIMQVTLESEIPVIFGIITCQTVELAKARSSSDLSKNKGYEAGKAALALLSS